MWLRIQVALHVKFGFHVMGLRKTSCSRSPGDEVRQVSRASVSIDGNAFMSFSPF